MKLFSQGFMEQLAPLLAFMSRRIFQPSPSSIGRELHPLATVFATVNFWEHPQMRYVIDSMVGAEGFEPPTLCSQIVTG
jgi:hypothetical protein